MNKLNQVMDKVMPFFTKLSQNRYLQAVSQGMMNLMPFLLIGSLSILLLVFPIDGVKQFFVDMELTELLASINTLTIGFMAVYVAFFVAQSFAKITNKEDDGIRCGMISLLCFLIITPLTMAESGMVLSFEWLGASGVFSAIITALISANVYVFLMKHNITIRMPQGVPPMVAQVFAGLVPCVVCAILFMIIRIAFASLPFGSMHSAIYTLIQTPLKNIGGNIWAIVFIATFAQLLWFFGIHGTNVTNPLITPILMAMDAENLSAAAAGLPLPNDVGYAFFITYTVCASAIGFAFLMLFAKSKQYRAIGKIAAPAAIFGISEPMVFGTPLVLNFTFAIPFIFANAIVLLMAYALTVSGIVPPCIGTSPVFGLPIGFHAAIQGDFRIILLQLLTQVVGALIYYPFFRTADKMAYQQEQAAIEEVEA